MQNIKYDYIIVGGGLCGLTLAKELNKEDKRILILEKGRVVRRLGSVIQAAMFYDKFAFSKSMQGVIIYRSFGLGGSSLVSCGNAVEPSEQIYKDIGINFKEEVEHAKKEYRINSSHFPIGRVSRNIMDAANRLGYGMHPMPKFGMVNECVSCGNCVLGCRHGAKWTALEFLKDTNIEKVKIITDTFVDKIITSRGKAIGVKTKRYGILRNKYFSRKIILCAGAMGTPVILQNSDVNAGGNLFVDLFDITYGISKDYAQCKEVSMAVVCDKFHKSDGFILSTFIDNIVGFYSSIERKYILKVLHPRRMMGIMTKIKDDNIGKVYKNGWIDKEPNENDWVKLKKGNKIAKEILIECGINPEDIVVTKLRGAHPGGTAGIGQVINYNLETKIKNLFVCDASILPSALGVPPMLTLIALSRWFARNVLEN